MNIDLRLGDCIDVLKTIPDNSIDSIVTDPPYGIGFMNKEWDNPTKLREQQERDLERAKQRGKVEASFSPFPGQGWKGVKEAKWFQEWCELWAVECLRILKPGGHILSFSAPRMYHRMATAFEDAGFEIRDQLMWVFGSGFPKSLNIGKAIDKKEGNEREVVGEKKNKINLNATKEGDKSFYESAWQNKDYVDLPVTKGNSEWEGWGTALKPAHEPIVMARKPLSEKSIVENVIKHGTGGINIDGSRIEANETITINRHSGYNSNSLVESTKGKWKGEQEDNTNGRFPANIIFDEEAGKLLDEQSGISKSGKNGIRTSDGFNENAYGKGIGVKVGQNNGEYGDSGGASRFFYCPKTSKKDRNEGLDGFEEKIKAGAEFRPNHMEKALQGEDGNPFGRWNKIQNNHPTVKPTDLMRYLINLVTPKGGTTLDPFMGSGSTGKAAVRCGVNFIGIEKEEEYMKIAEARIEHERNKPRQQELF